MTVAYYVSDAPCRRCNGTLRYKTGPQKGKCASCVACDVAEKRAKEWLVTAPETLTPDDEDPVDEMLVEGWDE